MSSGKSKSIKNPFGIRRTKAGLERAPKSLRLKGKVFICECSHQELAESGIIKVDYVS